MSYYASSSPPQLSFAGLSSSFGSTEHTGSTDEFSVYSVPPQVEVPDTGPSFREILLTLKPGPSEQGRRSYQEQAHNRDEPPHPILIPPRNAHPQSPRHLIDSAMQTDYPLAPPSQMSPPSPYRARNGSLPLKGGGRPHTGSLSIPQPKCLLWDNIFHPTYVEIPHFENEWQFAGLYTNHILFSQIVNTKSGKEGVGKKLLVFDVKTRATQTVKVKYDSAGLGPNGDYLLYRQMDEMHMYDTRNGGKLVKSASLRNLSRWTYNVMGFCIVDSSGKFWRWNFNDKLSPTLVFRLVDRAPRARLRCLTTQDGAWNAIVGTDAEKTQGEVHCYPSDNDEARIYKGVLAAFTQKENEEDGEMITFIAVVNVTSTELSFSMNQLSPFAHHTTTKRVETKMPIEAVGGSPSALFIDHELAVAVVLVSPAIPPSPKIRNAPPPLELPTFLALIFDLKTGTFLIKQDVTKHEGDSWVVDDTGVFRERSGSVVQRLGVIGDALPVRGSVADANARAAMGSPGGVSVGTSASGGVSSGGARVVGRDGRVLPVMPAHGFTSPRSPQHRPSVPPTSSPGSPDYSSRTGYI